MMKNYIVKHYLAIGKNSFLPIFTYMLHYQIRRHKLATF